MLKKVFYTFLSFLFATTANCQELPDYAMGMPEEFDKPYEGILKQISDIEYSRPWKVYSDRDNNKTYTTPGGSEVKKTIQFMDRFYVAEKEGDFLHIYSDPIRPNFPGISNSAESYGWIHINNLLLWEHCLVNPQNHIDKKAMILNTFEGTTSEVIEEQLVEYKHNPELTNPSGRKSRTFEILFVYKFADDAVLLGQDVGIYGNKEDVLGLIKGWVRIGSVTFWNHRFTLEPNWESAAYKERNQKGILPAIFSDARAALNYRSEGETDPRYTIWMNDPGAKRNIGEWRRFPILTTTSQDLYSTGVMGKITGSESMSIERYSEIKESSTDIELKKRRINVVFVIDGTESMGKYYTPISNGIINSVKMLNSDDTQNRLRFGAIVYRDKAEGEHLIDILSLQNDHNEIIEFLSKTRTDYSNDKDMHEAVFYGLKKALTSVGISREETNFIIVIGDAGNHNRNDETRVSSSEIINLSSEYECNYIFFQANNGYHNAYDDFIEQSQKIVLGTAEKIHQNNMIVKEKWRTYEYEKPYFISNEPNQYRLNKQEVVGSFLFPDKGNSLPYNELQKEIEIIIKKFDARTSAVIQEGKNVIEGQELGANPGSGEVSEYTEAVIGYLSKIKGLSDEEINMLKMRNYQFSMDGFTSREVKGLDSPVFKEVLFLSSNEMAMVLANLQKLISGYGSINQKRKQMQDVWLNLLKSQIGNIAEQEVMAMTIEEISELTLGLPVQSKFIKHVKLKDITEPSIVSDLDFENYLDYFRGKVNVLRSFLTEGYEQSFYSNNMRYYWIPVEDYP